MKRNVRFFAIVLCMILLIPVLVMPGMAASEVPYQTYTYDKWHNATPAPNGYLPTRSIGGAQLGCGNFNNAADMFYSEHLGKIFISDSGNARIVVLNENMELVEVLEEFTWENGESYRLNNPQGVFVTDSGVIYVCDMGNQDVLVCNEDGVIQSILPKPESNLLPDNFNYQPSKIVVDAVGRIYIISKGTYQGLIYLDTDGSFIKFFGPNNVEMTFRRQMLKIWKTILSDEAAATMQSFNPIEYGNLFLNTDGYIYATAAGSENGASLMTKLNPLGIDCLPFKINGATLFSDVSVDSDGIITMLDTKNGTIYQLDMNGKEMFIFGGIGAQTGLFQKPVSLIEVKGKLYIMDAEKNTITEFTMTQFGGLVRKAITLYDEGLYQESIEPWKEVISHNANYLLAYSGLGKAYYQLKDYETAMYYYKLANNREDFSEAFKESSLAKVRNSFSYIILGLIVLVVAIVLVKKWLDRRDETLMETLVRKLRKSKKKE